MIPCLFSSKKSRNQLTNGYSNIPIVDDLEYVIAEAWEAIKETINENVL